MTLMVDLWCWHQRDSSPRTMRGSCLCWRAQPRKASWRESWPVSLSVCGRTEVCKPASAAPVNISSTTRQHSESHTRTQTQGNSCWVCQNCESPTEKTQWSYTQQFMSTAFNDKVFHIRWPDAQMTAIPLQTHRKLLPQLAKHKLPQPSTVFREQKATVPCICLDFYTVNICPPLPSLKSGCWKRLFNLWPYTSAQEHSPHA